MLTSGAINCVALVACSGDDVLYHFEVALIGLA